MIATPYTVRSKIFNKKIKNSGSGITLQSISTRLLAPVIEEFGDHPLVDEVLKEYFASDIFKDVDALLLGCTHYSLVKDRIAKFWPNLIIDAAQVAAKTAFLYLQKNGMLNTKNIGQNKFFNSGNWGAFSAVATSLFQNDSIVVQQANMHTAIQ
jgi:glutamate racemase